MKKKIFDIELNYSIYGTGQPILFIHGNGLNKESMEKIYEPFFSKNAVYQRIYIDLPGMGESGSSKKIIDSDTMLEYIMKFIEELSLKHKLTLFGHSYGGYLCLGILHKMQENIKAAYLTCPVVYAEYHKRRVEYSKSIVEGKIIVKDNNSYYSDYLEMNTRINKKSWDLYNKTIIPGLEKANFEFIENIQRLDQRYYKFTFEDSLSIHCQTIITVLLGKYDHIVGYKDQLDFFQMFPNASLCVFSDGGHNLFIDNFEFNDLFVGNFIKRLE